MLRWPEFRDQAEVFFEQCVRDRHLGHLEDEVAPVAHDLGADLDQLLSEGCLRPVAHFIG